MGDHIQSAPPKQQPKHQQLEQFRAALESAKTHMAMLKGGHAHNALAIKVQERIIKQWQQRIAEITSSEDSWLT